MAYKILFDYGSEGYKFHDDKFYSVEDAVMSAVGLNYVTPFLIVEVHWEPKLPNQKPQ